MVGLLAYLAIVVILIIVVFWLLQKVNLPEPAGTIIQIAIVIVVAIIAIGFLAQFAGGAGLHLPSLH